MVLVLEEQVVFPGSKFLSDCPHLPGYVSAAPAPIVEYVSAAPAPVVAAPAPIVEYVTAAPAPIVAAPAPVVEYVQPAPIVSAPAPVVEYVQPAPTYQSFTTQPAQQTVYGAPQPQYVVSPTTTKKKRGACC